MKSCTIKHACGHEAVLCFGGSRAGKTRRLQAETERPCRACAGLDPEIVARFECVYDLDLADLAGTEDEVGRAREIRACLFSSRGMESLRENVQGRLGGSLGDPVNTSEDEMALARRTSAAIDRLARETRARWWLEPRALEVSAFVLAKTVEAPEGDG